MTKYIVKSYWVGSYCSGWCESRPFDTIDEARANLAEVRGPWRIVKRTETVLASGGRKPE